MFSTWLQLYLQYIKHPFAGVSFAFWSSNPKTSEKQVEWAEHPKWPVGQAWVPAQKWDDWDEMGLDDGIGMVGMKWNGMIGIFSPKCGRAKHILTP